MIARVEDDMSLVHEPFARTYVLMILPTHVLDIHIKGAHVGAKPPSPFGSDMHV